MTNEVNIYSSMSRNPVGRPGAKVSREEVQFLRNLGYTWVEVAEILHVSVHTLYMRRFHFDAPGTSNYDDISDEDLKNLLYDILYDTPYAGESYLRGRLRSLNVKIQRQRVRNVMREINSELGVAPARYPILRRTYQVPGPNMLW